MFLAISKVTNCLSDLKLYQLNHNTLRSVTLLVTLLYMLTIYSMQSVQIWTRTSIVIGLEVLSIINSINCKYVFDKMYTLGVHSILVLFWYIIKKYMHLYFYSDSATQLNQSSHPAYQAEVLRDGIDYWECSMRQMSFHTQVSFNSVLHTIKSTMLFFQMLLLMHHVLVQTVISSACM